MPLPAMHNCPMNSKSSNKLALSTPECIADYACETGENPLWHAEEGRLYWCDIPAGRIYRYHPASGTHECCYHGRVVGGFTIQSDGSLLLFMDRGTVAIWRNGLLTEILPEIEAEKASRFNDVLADPRGRVFCGTMSSSEGKGRLYRLDVDGSCHGVLEEIGCSNGMAFSMDHKSFYYTDSYAHAIYLFDYNIEDGSIRNQRVFARFEPELGFPDGVTLDAEGRLWSAIWDGSCIVRLDEDGMIETKVSLPARKVSSLIFGGADLSDLYITTAGGNNKAEEGLSAGALFRMRTSIHGMPNYHSRIAVPAAL